MANIYALFQSTLLQEERHCSKGGLVYAYYFNPRSYKRSDKDYEAKIAEHEKFQSTLLQEERRSVMRKCSAPYYFNPRSYKRSDINHSMNIKRKTFISIHAPTRGATAICLKTLQSFLFQSTLLQEERHGICD